MAGPHVVEFAEEAHIENMKSVWARSGAVGAQAANQLDLQAEGHYTLD